MPSFTLCYGTKDVVLTKVDSPKDPWVQTLQRDSARAVWGTERIVARGSCMAELQMRPGLDHSLSPKSWFQCKLPREPRAHLPGPRQD